MKRAQQPNNQDIIRELCVGRDYVTQDQVIGILAGEEEHRREFVGFLREYAQ